jgi:hypothetical protein
MSGLFPSHELDIFFMVFEFDFQLEIMHDFALLFNVKNVSDIPVPMESLVSDIPAGDGNVANLFLRFCL